MVVCFGDVESYMTSRLDYQLSVQVDELKLLSKILAGISKNDKQAQFDSGLQESSGSAWNLSLSQCDSVRQRIDDVVKALGKITSDLASSEREPVSVPKVRLGGNTAAATEPSVGNLSNRPMSQSTERFPKTPRRDNEPPTPAKSSSFRKGTAQESFASQSDSGRLRQPQKPALPKRPSVSTEGTFPRPRTTQHGSGGLTTRGAEGAGQAASQQELQHVLPATLYLALEAIVTALHCESASIFMPKNDEMIAVCNVSTTLAFPPSLLRHMGTNSMTGGVFASGVAIHQHCTETISDDSNRKVRSLMIFPIFGRGSSQRPIAVVQVTNKRRGTAPFDDKDEHFLLSASTLLGQLMERHPVNWHTLYYDPITLHSLVPFVPAPAALPKLLGAHLPKDGKSMREDAGSASVLSIRSGATGSSTDLPSRNLVTMPSKAVGIDDCVPTSFIPPRLIHRTTIPISLSRRQNLRDDSVPVGVAPSLLEVDSYMANLQDCWRRSVQMNVQAAHSDAARVAQLKKVREELNKHKIMVSQLSDELRLTQLDAGDYQKEYASLKEELETYLEQVHESAPLVSS